MSDRQRVILLAASGVVGALLAIVTVFRSNAAPVRATLILLFFLVAGAFVTLLKQPTIDRWKPILGAAAVAAGLLAAITIVKDSNSTSAGRLPTCDDVGNSSSGVKDTTYYAAFREAYDHAGGRHILGCPRDDPDDTSGYVHEWGEGYSQDLKGRNGLPARLMVLPPSLHVIVLQGTINWYYTHQFDRNSAPQLGYPITDPKQCGRAEIIHLAKGRWAPGAMIISLNPEEWIWLARPFWERYMKLGGPLSRLGLPVGQADVTAGQPVQRFEHGSLSLNHEKKTVKTDRELRRMPEPTPVRPLPRCLTAPK
jgi:hypothetical protein